MARVTGWLPNQHGAWAMLAAPLVAGSVASGVSWRHLLLATFWFLGYFAFFATALWLKSRRRPRHRRPMLVWFGLATAAGLATAITSPGLIIWAPLFVLPLGLGLAASAFRRERSLWSGLATTIGSCLMTVVAYDAGDGAPLGRAWLMAVVLALYFVGTVFYVKTVLRERGKRSWWWASVLFHALATVVVALISPWLGVLFAVLTARAALVPGRRPSPKQVGVAEIGVTVVVVALVLVTV